MTSLPRFFRKTPLDLDEVGIDVHITPSPIESISTLRQPIIQPSVNSVDPVRKAMLVRIALVSIEKTATLPAVLNDDSGNLPSANTIVQRIMLPRNPRIAGDELYELDGMDLIAFVSEEDNRISKDTVRWTQLLKAFGVPMVLLLPCATPKRWSHEKTMHYTQLVGMPIVLVAADNIAQAREDFLKTAMQIAPATGLALAAHIPHFRAPLMQHLLTAAIDDSLSIKDGGELAKTQRQLVRRICAAYGQNGQQLEAHKAALETLMNAVQHYSTQWLTRLPMRDANRRARLTQSVTTLFIGYAAAIYLGATPPSLRTELLPQLWRLYRASGQPVLKS